MRSTVVIKATLLALALARGAGAAPAAADLAGEWTGTLAHAGETVAVGLAFTPDTSGRVTLAYTLPVLHFDHATIAVTRFMAAGDTVTLGPFRFAFDRAHGTLSGVMPAALFPVHPVAVTLRRGTAPACPPRPAATSNATPVWTFHADSAVWAGPAWAFTRLGKQRSTGEALYVGTLAGTLYELDAENGRESWHIRLGGPIRCHPVLAGQVLYVHADDGCVYALSRGARRVTWKVRVEPPVTRLPFGDPHSKFDRFSSDVTVAGGQLYVGTHDGRVVALSAADGHELWSFTTGDAVLAAPAFEDVRVIVGSYDKCVYALDAASGKLLWKRDTGGRVVSTPAVSGGHAIVGNRIYDLSALDTRTGEVVWSAFQWGTWIESSASVRDGVAYVGSSDGACVSAWDVASGRRLWLADVLGWSWGQPSVTDDRVYEGSSASVGYPVPMTGSVVALDRRTGDVAWRWVAAAPAAGDWGVAGSVAVGTRYVFASGLDGEVVALPR